MRPTQSIKTMEKKAYSNQTLFFNNIKVDHIEESTAQANVLFGKESDLDQEVVCKQYSIFKLKAMVKEIRVFASLEKQRALQSSESMDKFAALYKEADGLP